MLCAHVAPTMLEELYERIQVTAIMGKKEMLGVVCLKV